MKTLIEDNFEIKFSGQFCVNFKTVRITDTVFLNILTTVQFYNLFCYLTLATMCSPQDLHGFPAYMYIIAVYFSAFRWNNS